MRHYSGEFFSVDPARQGLARGSSYPAPLEPGAQAQVSGSLDARRAPPDCRGFTDDGAQTAVAPGVTALIGLAVGFGIIAVVGGAVVGFGAWGLVACYVLGGNLGLILALVPSWLRTT